MSTFEKYTDVQYHILQTISAKKCGLKYLDADKDDQVRKFMMLDCAVITKFPKGSKGRNGTKTQKKGPHLGYNYSVFGVYEGYDPESGYENKSDLHYDT